MADEKKTKQEVLLEKILAAQLTQLFDSKFNNENERLAFFFTNGQRSAEQIGPMVGITGRQVRNYWKIWEKQGLVKLVKGTKTKYEKKT